MTPDPLPDKDMVRVTGLIDGQDPHAPVALSEGPGGTAYRGKAGCQHPLCTRDGNPDRCYGWHCSLCDKPSNMMNHHVCEVEASG